MAVVPDSEKSRKKVLLVDDSPGNIRLLLEVLKDDYQVVAAKEGRRALEIAAQSPHPDIILLDVVMPEMDGYEVCRQLKLNKTTQDIPVIFVTALAEHVSEERGFSAGAVDYITKPINPSIVRARVRTHLALKEANSKLAEQNKSLIEAAQLREDVERIVQHDLKGPLSTVIGMPTLLLNKENISEQQKDTLRLIQDAGYLMLGMINSSLDLYKMETGSYRYKPQPVDLLQVVRRTFSELQNLCEAHEVELQLRLNGAEVQAGDSFMVKAEELLTHTMFSNLLKNAIEASPEASTVDVELSSADGMQALSIRNRGEVPADIRERFFEKYVTAGKESGTGLGTYSAYMVVRTQGGDISLDCSQQGSTRITVRLNQA